MRRFVDARGRAWDVVPGRASWGAHYALFVPAGHGDTVRQTALQAASMQSAEQELDALDEDGLRALLDRSEEKTA